MPSALAATGAGGTASGLQSDPAPAARERALRRGAVVVNKECCEPMDPLGARFRPVFRRVSLRLLSLRSPSPPSRPRQSCARVWDESGTPVSCCSERIDCSMSERWHTPLRCAASLRHDFSVSVLDARTDYLLRIVIITNSIREPYTMMQCTTFSLYIVTQFRLLV